MGREDAAVDRAISRYLEALASTTPPSPFGKQLARLRDGLPVEAGAVVSGLAPASWDRVAAAGTPLRYCTRQDVLLFAARYWARTWASDEGSSDRRSAIVAYRDAARALGMTENRYRKMLASARARVRCALDEARYKPVIPSGLRL